jgi:hypothetical protein
MRRPLLILLLSFSCLLLVSARGKDSIPVPHHWNVIKINPTPAIIFGNPQNIAITYERLVKPNQSFVIQAGFLGIKPLFNDSAGGLMDIRRVSGFGLNLAFDYRFYLLRRNQFPAPDGLYLGPYLSYYGFKFKDEYSYNLSDTMNQSGSYSSAYNLVNLGISLGYQFIFWKRLSVDLLIFGPSLTYFTSTWEVTGDMSKEDEEALLHKIKEKFNEELPLLVPFVQPNQGQRAVSLRMFFRYSISIGFHF